MARQTSKNRWVNGKRTLAYCPNDSEFAGGCEMGTAIEMGHFYIIDDGTPETWPNSDKVRSYTVYRPWEYHLAIECFLNTGLVSETW